MGALDRASDRLFEPTWAGGWEVGRWMLVLAMVAAHVPRLVRIEDAYAASDLLLTSGPLRLAEVVRWTPPTAYAIYFLGWLGILLAALGGRATKPGLLLYLVPTWLLLAEEATNVKAHDRLMTFVIVGYLLSPASERGLFHKWRSPAARWYMIVVMSAIYGSTGILKLVREPGWFKGTTLAYHLVHQFHANNALAAWVSGHLWLTAFMGTVTVVFEVTFPVLVHVRRLNPWILLVGASFHFGLLAMMNVGPFGFVSLAAYPVLLHPEVARGLYLRFRREAAAPSAADPPAG
jgi:hypothetical protein